MWYLTPFGVVAVLSTALATSPADTRAQIVTPTADQTAEEAANNVALLADERGGDAQLAGGIDDYEGTVGIHEGPNTQGPGRVMAMQRALTGKGYDPGPIDGVIGRKTVAALKRYQETENLNVTGQMDPETAARLKI
jgi:peptidoglycan hydrolase-like protein with peptidoglycan-binding domain